MLIPFASCDDRGCAEARRTLRLPALEQLLARLQPAAADEGDEHMLAMPHERVLAREFGIAAPDGCVPWAAWQVAQAGRDPQGAAWAWITPCHWQVGQDHVAMAHPQQLQLSGEESQALLAAMRPYFEQDGIALEYEGPTQWLARGEVFRGFASASLDRVSGRVIDRWMPRGDAGKAVRRLQQEMQMLLYTNETNEERARGGLPVVNSFWLSGTGALPASAAPRAPDGLQVTKNLRDAALLQDWQAWASAWRQVDERECMRLVAALDRGEQVALTLCGERNARTFAGAGGGFLGKLRATLRGKRAAQVLESL
ncbi:phosphoglycerate mutase [Ramlibacter sp. PS4R-6]|uniref:phosphoglycerate mutase n=1 Tax=Ramlibacter sp. PS4R-6 TaxID=3133438 RepID=UPI0030AD0526